MIAALIFIGLSIATAPQKDPQIVVEGNRVLPAQVYRVLLDPPDSWPPSQEEIGQMALRVRRFLRSAGYELARVDVHLDGDVLIADVDEGRLERVIFPGQSGLGALRLQLELDLPGDVFNRPQLEEQLRRFEAEHEIEVKNYKLVPLAGEPPNGIQIADLGEIRGVPIIPQAGKYELEIFVAEKELPPGVHLDVEGKSADGLVTRLKYRTLGLLLDDERWEAAGEVGLRLQDIFGGDKDRRFVSRGGLALRWYSPRLASVPLRLVVEHEVVWLSRQRPDLGVMRYDDLLVQPTAVLSYQVFRLLNLSLGGGLEYQHVFSLVRDPGATAPLVSPPDTAYPLILANATFELGRDSQRLDRFHRVALALLSRVGGTDTTETRISLGYDTTLSFGFDDLQLAAKGAALFGHIAFTDEERLGDQLRGLFNDRIFCRQVAAASAEYRLSLAREMYKVSAFHDGAVCSEASVGRTVWANAFGLGFHALMLDTFRFSIYLAQGFASPKLSDQGVSIRLSQVF